MVTLENRLLFISECEILFVYTPTLRRPLDGVCSPKLKVECKRNLKRPLRNRFIAVYPQTVISLQYYYLAIKRQENPETRVGWFVRTTNLHTL